VRAPGTHLPALPPAWCARVLPRARRPADPASQPAPPTAPPRRPGSPISQPHPAQILAGPSPRDPANDEDARHQPPPNHGAEHPLIYILYKPIYGERVSLEEEFGLPYEQYTTRYILQGVYLS
jgi:hypothetical protein